MSTNSTVKEIVAITLMNIGEVTEFEVKDHEVHMNRLINTQTYDQFVKILEKNPKVTTIVEIDIDDDTVD